MLSGSALWIRLLFSIAVSLIISFVFTPLVKSFAEKIGAMDIPKEARRVHDHPIPRMGGLAIFLGFLISVLLFADLTQQVKGTLIGAIIIVAIGAIDDIVNLKYWIKLIAQLTAAGIAIFTGTEIHFFSLPLSSAGPVMVILGALSIPITIIWIVGITNSVNLIDGLDGLAVGVSAISCITMLAAALISPDADINVAVILSCLVGACLGFMPYNINPAKIFMGDTGALMLGYILATVSVMGLFKFYALVSFAVPILALALPMADTLFAIVRRVLRGQNPMTPDRGHFHHRLLDMGMSQKQAVAVLYAVSAVLGLLAVSLASKGILHIVVLIAACVIAVVAGIIIYCRSAKHRASEKHALPDTEENNGEN